MPYLDAIDKIKASSLSKDEQLQVLKEMEHSFIDIVFCRQCPNTHAIILKKLGEANGSTKGTAKEVAKKGTEVSKEGAKGQRELLLKANANGGRKSTKKTVVKQKT